ncbi:transglycosylase SLT domain-containing protein [bacterium]|nr:transglycosylase SLT domain-containing protein [bacterium]
MREVQLYSSSLLVAAVALVLLYEAIGMPLLAGQPSEPNGVGVQGWAKLFSVQQRAESNYDSFQTVYEQNWTPASQNDTAVSAAHPSEQGRWVTAYDRRVHEQALAYDQRTQQQMDVYDWKTRRQARAYDEMVEQQREAYERHIRRVQAYWGQYLGSTQTTWVEYSDIPDTRGFVDFEAGVVVYETLVPADAPDPEARAEKNLRRIVEQTETVTAPDGRSILADQLDRPESLHRAAEHPLARGVVRGEDGRQRLRFAVGASLVPDHLQRRAERFLPMVERYARHYQVDPALVLAMIETESAFNPRAVSSAHAHGLMQLIPQYGGREAYALVHGSDGIPAPELLFDPDTNIRLGCAYLHLLGSRHFAELRQDRRKDYTVIAGYNWGPGNVRRKVIDRYGSPDGYSEQQWFSLLRQHTPRETSNYLDKVVERRARWAQLLETSQG